MKKETIKRLVEKYEAGKTTLEEEQFLFETADTSAPKLKALAAFVKEHKKNTPEDFNTKMWDTFENKNLKKRRFKIRLIAVAATVLLLITMTINSFQPKELSYAEKKALLDEALSMFDETEQIQTAQNIIYEDDVVIVYTKPE